MSRYQWHHEEIEILARRIEAETGIVFTREQFVDLSKRVRKYFKDQGVKDVQGGLLGLINEGEPLPGELINYLVIPETYFLRNTRLFHTLKRTILPEIISRKSNTDRTISIWSAGCSTGEEPYSLAIILYQILSDIDCWNIRLLATDINPLALQKARAAIYSEWSFRNNASRELLSFFRKLNTKQYQLKEEIRQHVTFLRHNLIKDPFPPVNSIQSFDLILCRNVMLYMREDTIEALLKKFSDVLAQHGYLVTGPGEIPVLRNPILRPRIIDSTTFYIKQETVSRTVKKTLLPARCRNDSQKLPVERHSQESVEEPLDLQSIRLLADSGLTAEALSVCEKYVHKNPLNAEGYYLLGSILMERGNWQEAENYFRKVLYLEPEFVMAHLALANIDILRSNAADASKRYQLIMQMLSRRDENSEIPGGDGMVVAQLKKMIEQFL